MLSLFILLIFSYSILTEDTENDGVQERGRGVNQGVGMRELKSSVYLTWQRSYLIV